MIRMIYTVLYFIKHLVYRNPRQYDVTSKSFDTRKFTLYLVMVLVIAFNAIFIRKIYYLATQISELSAKVAECQVKK